MQTSLVPECNTRALQYQWFTLGNLRTKRETDSENCKKGKRAAFLQPSFLAGPLAGGVSRHLVHQLIEMPDRGLVVAPFSGPALAWGPLNSSLGVDGSLQCHSVVCDAIADSAKVLGVNHVKYQLRHGYKSSSTSMPFRRAQP
jgi:hypothetical protein